MPFADVNGQRISFDDTGGDGLPVILAHGFLMDREMFEPQVRELAPEFRVITWDERGFGETDDGYILSGTAVYADRRLTPTLATDSAGAPLRYQVEVRSAERRQELITLQIVRGHASQRTPATPMSAITRPGLSPTQGAPAPAPMTPAPATSS